MNSSIASLAAEIRTSRLWVPLLYNNLRKSSPKANAVLSVLRGEFSTMLTLVNMQRSAARRLHIIHRTDCKARLFDWCIQGVEPPCHVVWCHPLNTIIIVNKIIAARRTPMTVRMYKWWFEETPRCMMIQIIRVFSSIRGYWYNVVCMEKF